ncbi:hypothetical protein KSS87_006345 [Heliosperma pusillum]|nr:hypothetical protein KSS87_006345 [Heliosperma pusillum]
MGWGGAADRRKGRGPARPRRRTSVVVVRAGCVGGRLSWSWGRATVVAGAGEGVGEVGGVVEMGFAGIYEMAESKPEMRKPVFTKVEQLRPGTSGHNLTVKIVSSKLIMQRGRPDASQARQSKIAECLVGDETGIIVFTARNDQVDKMKAGTTVTLRNAKIDMFKGSMRLAVDKWGRIEEADSADFTVKEDNNLSLIEFELVNVVEGVTENETQSIGYVKSKTLIKGMRYSELENWVQSHGFRPGQAMMLWKRLYGNNIWAQSCDELEGLNKDLRKMLSEHAEFTALFLKDVRTASDGTRKGMGEPLQNIDNVLRAADVMVDEQGLYFSPRKVTISTSGLVPQLKRFLHESNCAIAVSLNATTDEVRNWIMPINRKYNLEVLLGTLRDELCHKHNYQVLFEYVMLAGVNDSMEDAKRLIDLVEDIPCKINLISFNPHSGSFFKPTTDEKMIEFRNVLAAGGRRVFLRPSRGDDQMAACGQLGNLGNLPVPLFRVPSQFEKVLNT